MSESDNNRQVQEMMAEWSRETERKFSLPEEIHKHVEITRLPKKIEVVSEKAYID